LQLPLAQPKSEINKELESKKSVDKKNPAAMVSDKVKDYSNEPFLAHI